MASTSLSDKEHLKVEKSIAYLYIHNKHLKWNSKIQSISKTIKYLEIYLVNDNAAKEYVNIEKCLY